MQLALIESQLLSELEKHQKAADVLAKARKKFPDEKRLAVAYARKLTKVDLPAAERELAALLVTDDDDSELLMTHALVAAENKQFAAARNSLQRLISLNSKTSFAWYNLGLVAQQEDKLDEALNYFEKVKQGQHLPSAIDKIIEILTARQQIEEAQTYLASIRSQYPMLAPTAWGYEARILDDNGQTEDALRVLNAAILQFPQQHRLRMQRSYISDNLGNIQQAESDLRYVLEREPNNPEALNALGYILADRTTRYTEARDLIEKAMKLMPGSAAITDSLGWVLYKQGDIQGAIEKLEQALDITLDDEIAAHLIEVYWLSDQHGAARKTYRRLRKEITEHPKVDKTLERLNISF